LRPAARSHLQRQFAAQFRRALAQAAQAVAPVTRFHWISQTLSVVGRRERDVTLGGAYRQPDLLGRGALALE
jgi:hypothetical protein